MQPSDKPAGSRAGKPRNYSELLAKIKQRIRSAQYAALKAVNQELIGLYRDIGRMKAFFEAHIGLEKLAPLVREIAWSHNLAIMNQCKDPLELLKLWGHRHAPSGCGPISTSTTISRRS